VSNGTADQDRKDHLLELLTDIISAYVKGNRIPAAELPSLIESVHATLESLSGSGAAAREGRAPAVAIEDSVSGDFIICLEDGKKLTMLKRYLRTHYGLTPEAYRAKWGLPADYPMVAPNYAAKRSKLAREIGLGKNRGARET
jgi:predicted transcriptional regulator